MKVEKDLNQKALDFEKSELLYMRTIGIPEDIDNLYPAKWPSQRESYKQTISTVYNYDNLVKDE